MKLVYAVAASIFAAAPAAAETSAAPPQGHVCIDPHWSYQARWLSGNTIVAEQTLGHNNRELKISTTCIDLEGPDTIRLGSTFSCVGLGDEVFASKIDGHSQRCRISHVEPYVPAPAAQD